MDTFIKQPGETIDYTLDCSDSVSDGDSISAVVLPVISIALYSGEGALPTLGAMTVNLSGNTIKQRISGGVDGQVCIVTCKVTTTAGEVLEGEVKLKIKEVG